MHAAMQRAFDVTTKGILHAVFERGEFWRLRDASGKPPGLIGWWALPLSHLPGEPRHGAPSLHGWIMLIHQTSVQSVRLTRA